MIATLLIAGWLWRSATESFNSSVAHEGGSVADALVGGVDEIDDWLAAVAALWRTNGALTGAEFTRFTEDLGVKPGMAGWAYVPVVKAEDLEAFVTSARESFPEFEVFGWDPGGGQAAEAREVYAPILYATTLDPYGSPQGFDELSEPLRRAALERSALTGELSLTPVLQLVAIGEDDGFVAALAVREADTGELEGYVVSALRLSRIVEENLPPALRRSVEWTITDVTASHPAAAVRSDWRTTVDLGGRTWEVAVQANSRVGLPAGVLFALLQGTAGSCLAAAGVYLLARRSEGNRQVARLREAEQVKNSFLAAVSHQLRTPLTAVLGYGQLLQEDSELSAEERMAMADAIVNQAGELEYLLQDVIAVTRMEEGILTITPSRVCPAMEVALVLIDWAAVGRRPIRVVDELEADDCVVADPYRVRQIIRILLDNAQHWGGASVEVRLRRTDTHIGIAVADNGEGVPPEHTERIFELYHSAHQDTQPGTLGVGLTVAQRLAELMGGTLEYRRQHGWTVFDLTLAQHPPSENTKAEPEPTFARA